MELLPEEELKPKASTHFAPMIDFLFLMLALFATLALSRSSLFDGSIELSKASKGSQTSTPINHARVNLSVNQKGHYFWVSEFSSHEMKDIKAIIAELSTQYENGLLPENKQETEIFLHIDKNAPWDPIAQLILSLKEYGFNAKPLYEMN
jgi:biopolymer transport protein ExbD